MEGIMSNEDKYQEAVNRLNRFNVKEALKTMTSNFWKDIAGLSTTRENTPEVPKYNNTNGTQVAILDNKTHKVQYLKLPAELFSEEHFDKKQAIEIIQNKIKAVTGEEKEMAELIYAHVNRLNEYSQEASSTNKISTKNGKYNLAVENTQGAIGEPRLTQQIRTQRYNEWKFEEKRTIKAWDKGRD